jgi:hypothetical protein
MLDDQDLKEFSDTIFTGVTVGYGSLILLFSGRSLFELSRGAHIALQSIFECHENGNVQSGHGENMYSSPLLFGYLNHQVTHATFDAEFALSLYFDDGKYLKIIAERNTIEPYVVSTQRGIVPIMARTDWDDPANPTPSNRF